MSQNNDSRFPEKVDYIISPTTALSAIDSYLGFSLFCKDDFKEAGSLFIAKIKSSSDPFAIFIKQKLTLDQDKLVDEMNQILKSECIYDKERFTNITLSDKTKQLLTQNPNGDRLVDLNRLLLEDAYPKEIEKSDYHSKSLFFFKILVNPLVPKDIRNFIAKAKLDNISISYENLINKIENLFSLINKIENLLSLFVNLEKKSIIKKYERFIILPYLELKFREKINNLEQKKPWYGKILRWFYQSNLDYISPLVDNLVNLVTLAWRFCPAIGEPDQETGYYNRFVFTSNAGFVDLGHFFNCAIIAYLYGAKPAHQRAENTERRQRKLREMPFLKCLKDEKDKNSFLLIITNLLWGYATSADTIEDRSSDLLGIELGEAIRTLENNEKIMNYYFKFYQKFIKKSVFSKFFLIIGNIKFLCRNKSSNKSSFIDIKNYMENFFNKYDAIDPLADSIPEKIFEKIVNFYKEKYESDEWDKFTCKDWYAIIPQELWEKVVRGREKFHSQNQMKIKIQLKTGELLDPYFEEKR